MPFEGLCSPLEALAQYSGNRVAMLGYDTIPVVSADTVPEAETERFVKYLAVVKHADLVVGISETAAAEFEGFSSAVTAQGLPGPLTAAVTLPVDIRMRWPIRPTPAHLGARCCALAVRSRARTTWRCSTRLRCSGAGIEFDLVFIGNGSAWYVRIFDRAVARLRRRGREVTVLRHVDDAALLAQYERAAFTVFPSIHEGYGLPVAESLALGVPVITTSYGSTAEIARDGGCLTVDPRDDDALVAAMRSLLTDPARLAELRRGDRRPPTAKLERLRG